jgi:hypothetical protein
MGHAAGAGKNIGRVHRCIVGLARWNSSSCLGVIREELDLWTNVDLTSVLSLED